MLRGSMTENFAHRVLKHTICGCAGRIHVERRLEDGRKLDCVNETTRVCAEVENDRRRIENDIDKLLTARRSGLCDRLLLIVNQSNYAYAESRAKDKEIQVLPHSTETLISALMRCTTELRNRKRLIDEVLS